MTLSNEGARGVLRQCILGTAPGFSPGTISAGLAANAGAEMAGTGYARQVLGLGLPTAGNPAVATSGARVSYGQVGGDWTNLTNVDQARIFDALSTTQIADGIDAGGTLDFVAGEIPAIEAGFEFRFGANAEWAATYCQQIVQWLAVAGSTPPRARYLALMNNATELSGGNYARLDTDGLWADPSLADPSIAQFTGGAQEFSASPTFSGPVTHMALFDALTAGNELIRIAAAGTITAAQRITVNPQVSLT